MMHNCSNQEWMWMEISWWWVVGMQVPTWKLHSHERVPCRLSSCFFEKYVSSNKNKQLVVICQYAILLAYIQRFWLVRTSVLTNKLFFETIEQVWRPEHYSTKGWWACLDAKCICHMPGVSMLNHYLPKKNCARSTYIGWQQQHYITIKSAIKTKGTSLKPNIVDCSPFCWFFNYGANKEGYWNFHHAAMQLEDVVDCLVVFILRLILFSFLIKAVATESIRRMASVYIMWIGGGEVPVPLCTPHWSLNLQVLACTPRPSL